MILNKATNMERESIENSEMDLVLMKVSLGMKLCCDEAEIYADYVDRNRISGISDCNRWSSNKSFSNAWNDRTEKLAKMIPDATKSVADYGCGTMWLKKLLPTCVLYIPIDMVRRSAEGLVVDLNSPLINPLPKASVAFFSGVLEYVNDLPNLISSLSKVYTAIVCSYVGVRSGCTNFRKRRSFGWVNDYRISELLGVFEDNMFHLQKMDKWGQHSLMSLKRSAGR